jgi:hypothetical protein
MFAIFISDQNVNYMLNYRSSNIFILLTLFHALTLRYAGILVCMVFYNLGIIKDLFVIMINPYKVLVMKRNLTILTREAECTKF